MPATDGILAPEYGNVRPAYCGAAQTAEEDSHA